MSSGITITPGTFHAPAPLVEVRGVVTWPQAVSGWKKKRPLQWHAMPAAAVEAVYPSTVEHAEFNYVTGYRYFKDSTAPETPAAQVRPQGVRYVGSGDFPVEGVDVGGLYTCVPQGAVYAPAGVVEAGEITIGNAGKLRVILPYTVILAGTAGDVGAVYAVEAQTGAAVTTVPTSGSLQLDITVVNVGMNPMEITLRPQFALHLVRNGERMDSVFVEVPVHFVANFSGSGGVVEHAMAESFVDALFGLKPTGNPYGTLPTIPFTSYSRAAYQTPGKLIFL